MSNYKLISYDLINDGDSCCVNAAYYTGITLNIEDTDTDAEIVRKLIDCGFASELLATVAVQIDGDCGYLYVNADSELPSLGMVPFCELRAE